MTLKPSTRNITRVYRQATDAQIASGMAWYDVANDEAVRLSGLYNVTVDVASGVIAALSPMMSWAANKLVAERIIRAQGTATDGALKANIAKANRIILGEPVLDVLTSDKVRNFYLCIAARGETNGVCVDRHAMDIAVNTRRSESERGKLTPKQYAEYAAAYQRAASILGVPAAKVQAITWVAWRARYWSEGAFDTARSAA